MKMTKSRKAVQLQTIKENENGIVAFACGIISTISFIVLIFISYLHAGQANMGLGLVGFFSMVFSLVGLFLGIKNIRYGDRSFFFTKAGFFVNVVIVIVWALVFIFGTYH